MLTSIRVSCLARWGVCACVCVCLLRGGGGGGGGGVDQSTRQSTLF